MFRIAIVFCFLSLISLAGCATKSVPTSGEIAKLQGGTTKVVVYGFCVPMDHLIKTTLTRMTLTYVVNGKNIGTIKTCGYKSFSVQSGYWESHFLQGGLSFPIHLPKMIFRPGQTQYLYMKPAGYGTFEGEWVGKSEAEKSIANIKQINQLF